MVKGDNFIEIDSSKSSEQSKDEITVKSEVKI